MLINQTKLIYKMHIDIYNLVEKKQPAQIKQVDTSTMKKTQSIHGGDKASD